VKTLTHGLVLLAVAAGCAVNRSGQATRTSPDDSPVARSSPDMLIGVWGSELIFGPLVRGELILDGRGPEWQARIAGFDAPVQRQKEQIRFELPGGRGEFRGHPNVRAKEIVGHWIQPTSSIFSQRYATPVTLSSAEEGVWIGQIKPLEERLSFYISIHHAADGSLSAVIRNPEFGWLSRGTYRVTLKDGGVVFSNEQNELRGTFDSKADSLTLSILDPPAAPILLTRRREGNAMGLYPRVPWQQATYVYLKPPEQKDGWATATLEETGIDPKPISALVQSILDADPYDVHSMPVHALLIARHGKLVLEEYFYGFDRQRPHDTRSAGKTLAPMMLGIARDHGGKVDPSTPVYPLFPEYRPFGNWDQRKNNLTVEDLMTMTPGLACDDNDSSSPGLENRMQSQTEQRDWYKYTLDLPLAHNPGGTTAIYCSASLNLVGGVAERASGTWGADLFDRYIARPLQFGLYHLNLMPTGSVYTGGGAYLRPRDELKLGQVYLSGGLWNGQRIVSQKWVELSTAYHATFIRPVVDIDLNHQYGYGWHIHQFTVAGHVYREYAAEGNGGQLVMVIPEVDLVVAINGGKYGSLDWYRWALEVLPRYLIPAALGAHKVATVSRLTRDP
jgi:CubicO group peptidase (beta-lactamase class C family)